MYNETAYTGAALPNKTLCLTYDDGPGKHTAEIAAFLYQQGIQATFFVVGKYAAAHPDVLYKLNEWGHLIGNHTYDHPDATYYQSMNGDIQHQVLKTDAIIKNYIPQGKIYFRAPYGKWSKEVAGELNGNIIASLNHIGPIYWDVGGMDCYYWQQGFSVQEAVDKYISDINKINHGIVLLHDDIADMDVVKYQNKTLELTKQLIPVLKEQGYTFVRLDEINSIKNAAEEIIKLRFKDSTGRQLIVTNKNEIVFGKSNNTTGVEIIDLGLGKVAIKASNGLYLNNNASTASIDAINQSIDDHSSFDLIPVTANQFMFRCSNGNFFTVDQKTARLLTGEKYMKGAAIFYINALNLPDKKRQGFKTEFKLIRKRLLYIKSKILQG